MGFSKVRPYKIIYTTSIFRFLVSSKSLQSFILYTFNDIFQCQRLSTTLVIYVWMLWGWRLPLPRPLAAAQTKKKKERPSRWDTWLKRWRSLGKVGVPAPRKSWVHFMRHGKQWRCHGWMPPLSSRFVAYFRILYFSLFFGCRALVATPNGRGNELHWWWSWWRVRKSLTFSSATIGKYFPSFYFDDTEKCENNCWIKSYVNAIVL